MAAGGETSAKVQQVRWGILGAGGIAKRFAASLKTVEGAELVAVSGRSAEKLATFAPARAYADGADGSAAHRELLADPEVDAIYLALPHAMHRAWAIAALEAGKPVLCEKPATISADDAKAIACIARRTGTLFVEAMKCRFVPLHARVRALIDGGELGSVQGVECVQHVDYGQGNLRYLEDPVGGGALLDLGCYSMSWIEEFTAGEPLGVEAHARWRDVPGGRVDWAGRADFAFADGIEASVDWAGDSPEYACSTRIVCERGGIDIERAHRPERAIVHCDGEADEVIEALYDPDDFHGEIAHFCELFRSGAGESPVMPLDATVRNAALIDRVRTVMA